MMQRDKDNQSTLLNSKKLTQILQAVAGLVKGPSIELQSDDGEDEDSEEEKKGDVDKGSNSFSNGAHNNL